MRKIFGCLRHGSKATLCMHIRGLFRRLESMAPREKLLQLKPGQILLAVYGNNW